MANDKREDAWARRSRAWERRWERRSHAWERRFARGDCGATPQAFFGALFIALGVAFLLDNLNIVETRTLIRTGWPLLLVAWGGSRLLMQRGEPLLAIAAIAVGGLLFGSRVLGWQIQIWVLLWPAVFIFIGVRILMHAWRPAGSPGGQAPAPQSNMVDGEVVNEPEDSRTDSSASIRQFAFMAGVERRNISQTFRGGQITTFMGSVELDLRECRMAPGEAVIDLFVVLGNVVLRIPRDWMLESRAGVILAGLDDRSEPPVAGSPKRLVLTGTAFLGGIEIRN